MTIISRNLTHAKLFVVFGYIIVVCYLDLEHGPLLTIERVHHPLESLAHSVTNALLQFLTRLAQGGAVLVSPCISPGEKEVMRRAFLAGVPQIVLLENGFAPMQKPSGQRFDACSEGRLLLVAPWEHHNEQRAITREQCLALNRLADEITTHRG